MYYDKRIEEVEAPAPVKLEPWQEQLLEAANLIRRYGWHRGSLGSAYLGYCVVGALKVVLDMSKESLFSTAYITPAFKFKRFIGTTGALYQWNDAPGRTKEEVIAALEGAAKAG